MSAAEALAAIEAVPPLLTTLPERFARKMLAGFRPGVSDAARKGLEAAVDVVLAHAEGRRPSLVLVGPPGAGKSHLAAGIANAIWEADWRVFEAARRRFETDDIARRAGYPVPAVGAMWANVPALINRLRGGDDDVRRHARSLAAHAGLVVLDDLGREKVTEWTGETIYVLVNERYERQLSTVVTSNLTVRDLADNGYGPAISRLAEDGRLLEMATAVDYRLGRHGRASA